MPCTMPPRLYDRYLLVFYRQIKRLDMKVRSFARIDGVILPTWADDRSTSVDMMFDQSCVETQL